MMRAPGRNRWALCALALLGACAKDKTTALDLELQVTGTIDQVRIDAVTVGGNPVALNDEPTLMFPASPRTLKDGEVLTFWFADSTDKETVVVTATGLRCGMPTTAQTMTAPTVLAKGQTVKTTLALDATLTVMCADGGAGMGGAGRGGAAGGVGGGGGTSGAAGTSGSGGMAGSAGAGGVAGSTAGAAGRGGAGGAAGGGGVTGGVAGSSGRGGAGGTAGSAGRGGTTGAGGAAGRGGAGGSAGTGGAAGRGGTTGAGGTAGRGGSGGGGTTGTGGGGPLCATPPMNAGARIGSLTAATTGCGYPVGTSGVDHLLTATDRWATANAAVLNAGTTYAANCGRCVELVRTKSDNTKTPVVVTLVGACLDPQSCQQITTPRFELSNAAYAVLATMSEPSLPSGANETLTYSFVPCPLPANQSILADFQKSGNFATGVLFVQQRYGIASASVEDPAVPQPTPMFRNNTGYFVPNNGNPLPTNQPTFRITDVNGITLTLTNLPPLNVPAFVSTGQQFPICGGP